MVPITMHLIEAVASDRADRNDEVVQKLEQRLRHSEALPQDQLNSASGPEEEEFASPGTETSRLSVEMPPPQYVSRFDCNRRRYSSAGGAKNVSARCGRM